jgi:hypothetical protein
LAISSFLEKELLNQFKLIEQLPNQDKTVVKIFLDAFINNGKIKLLAI